LEPALSIKTPRLIQDRCGVFYFRLIVPLSLRQIVKKTEIRRSLRTKDAGMAREAALLLSARMEALLSNSKKSGLEKTIPALTDWMTSNEAFKMKVRIFKNGEAEIETDTLEEAREARAIVAEHAKMQSRSAHDVLDALPASRCGMTLEAANKDFQNERTSTLSKKGTMPKLRGTMKAFIAFVGNLDVAMITPAKVKDYKKSMLDSNKAATTINDHLVILTGFFDYCIGNHVAKMQNPVRGLLIPRAQNKAESYEVFTLPEIGRIFSAGPYLKRMGKLPDFYWGPLIALFSGARAEEIASLEVDHIRLEKGVWIIDITKGKNENAVRRVPIHDKLIELGLLEYSQIIRATGYRQLFPHLIDGKNGYKKNMCRMFGDHLDAPDINIVHELKVFHSFRHTVVTALTDKGVNEGQKRAIVGHDIDSKDSAHEDYTHLDALTLPNLRTAVNKLDYEGIDFDPLKLPQDTFLPRIAQRIEEQKARAEKAEEKAKAEALAAGDVDSQVKPKAKKAAKQ
jgi:integrase